MIAIIDYDAGNLKSVEKALETLGQETVITRDPNLILSSDKVILPGVGAFGQAMELLKKYGLDEVIIQVVRNKIPLLGICLGMQLLFEWSEESPQVPGLGIFSGKICKIPESKGIKIPHMGWNSLSITSGTKLFKGMESGEYVYFVHSYYLKAKDSSIVAASTEYGTRIDAAVERDSIFACQFHPEKSGSAGLGILGNFIEFS